LLRHGLQLVAGQDLRAATHPPSSIFHLRFPSAANSATGRTLQRQERCTTPVEKAEKWTKKWIKSGIKQVPALISELFWDKNYKNDSFFVRKHSKITGHTGC
jgi:hypothetical protein